MATEQTPSFGLLLKRYRHVAGCSQAELAERAGYSVDFISMIERGRRRPSATSVHLLARALEITPDEEVALQSAFSHRPASERPPAPGTMRPVTSGTRTVGRDDEIVRLMRLLAGDGPPVMLFAGEPGIGKTHLLHEAIDRGGEAGWRIVAGGCRRSGGQQPYAPLLEVLERAVQVESSDRLEGCAWLSKLLPELVEMGAEPPLSGLPPEQERRLMFRAARRYLANIAGPAGTLLVLDDLQWADRDAIDLLTSLIVGAGPIAIRVVAAYRSTEAAPTHPLALMVTDLMREGLAECSALGPLPSEDTAALLAHLLDGAHAVDEVQRAAVLQRSNGVPLFLVSFAQALRSGSAASRAGGVPWDLVQGIRQRIAALSERALRVFQVVAVSGTHVNHRVLCVAARMTESEVLIALDQALAVGLIIEDGHAMYRMGHDVIREVAEMDMGAARRQALHGRIGAALEELFPVEALQASHQAVPASAAPLESHSPGIAPVVDLLAYHYARYDDDEKAMRYLESAGDGAWERHASARAAECYGELAIRADARRQTAIGARAYEKRGIALEAMGRFDEALTTLEQSVQLYCAAESSADTAEDERRVTVMIGLIYGYLGTPQEGVARIKHVLGRAGPDASRRTLADLHRALAILYRYDGGRYAEGLAAATRATELAGQAGDDRSLAEAETWRGLSLQALGRLGEARGVLERGLLLAERATSHVAIGNAASALASGFLLAGERTSAHRYYIQALDLAKLLGDPATLAGYTGNFAYLLFRTGKWEEARVHFEQSIALYGESEAPLWHALFPRIGLAHIRLLQGTCDAELSQLESDLARPDVPRDLHLLRRAHALLATRDLVAGQPDAACARLGQLLDRPGLEEMAVTEFLPTLARAHLAAEIAGGPSGRAEATAAQAVRRSRAQGANLLLTEALHVQGQVHVWQGNHEAEHAFTESIRLAHAIPYPYIEALALSDYGTLLAQQGERARARQRLEQAQKVLKGLHAYADVRRVEETAAVLCSTGAGIAGPQ